MTEPLTRSPLTSFEESDVVAAAIEIPNAGGGFQEAMKFAPVELHHGQKVFVVLECEVRKVRFDPIKASDELTRVHVLTASAATMVDRDLVITHLDDQQERIRLAREAAEGIQRLPMDSEAYASPEDAHAAGEHASGLHPDCGECNAEAAAVEAEREAKMWGPTRGVGPSSEAVLDLPKGPGLHSVPDPEKPAKGKKAAAQ